MWREREALSKKSDTRTHMHACTHPPPPPPPPHTHTHTNLRGRLLLVEERDEQKGGTVFMKERVCVCFRELEEGLCNYD